MNRRVEMPISTEVMLIKTLEAWEGVVSYNFKVKGGITSMANVRWCVTKWLIVVACILVLKT